MACNTTETKDNITNEISPDSDSNCTLDKIAHDMKNVLEGVKKNLTHFQLKQDSYSDVVPELENMIKKDMMKYEKNNESQEFDNDGVEMYVQETQDTFTATEKLSSVNKSNPRKKIGNSNKKSNKMNIKSDIKIMSKRDDKNSQESTNKLVTLSKINVLSTRSDLRRNPIKKFIENKSSKVKKPNNVNESRSSSPCSAGGSLSKIKMTCETCGTTLGSPRGNRNITSSSSSASTVKKNFPLAAINTASTLLRNYSIGSGSKSVRPKSTTSFLRKRLCISPGNIDRNVYNPLAQYKEEVDAAIRARKTFTVRGSFMAVRRALIRRGWIEKMGTTHRDLTTEELRTFAHKAIVELLDLIRQRHQSAELCKKLIRSKLLSNHQVDLYWGFNYNGFKECTDQNKLTLINKIRWTSPAYTSKQALSAASRKAIWYHIPGVANLNHPRSYRLVKEGDAEEFVKDFYLTAAMSLLKWIKMANDTQQSRIMSTSGKVPIKFFDFAINECYKFIKRATHQDIDHDIKEALSPEWNMFLDYFYKIVHVGNHFKQENNVTVEAPLKYRPRLELDLVRRASFILEKLKDHWPFLDMDGLMNIWILKPTNSCRGLGIHMCRTLNYVLDTIKDNPHRRYIIQKYIERPMLIYSTKFDIRQWFLISSCCPLTIWIYRQCYLRFSSQTYNLRKLHESIHLTNNSVQCKYQNHTKDLNLPSFNMWDSIQLKNYLSDIGYPKVYNDIIYPGMKECIVAAVLTHYENIDTRHNSFELYGADFILTEDFKPWLLEINSNPALYASTPITARLCPRVLEDVIKVIVDNARDNTANTGGFELLYKGTDTKCKQKELSINGKNIKIQKYSEQSPIKSKESNIVRKVLSTSSPQNNSELGIGMKKTLEGLLDLIQKERERREEKLLNRVVASVKLDSEIQTHDTDTYIVSAPKMAEVAIQS